ncbi:MAG: hypothetical protein C0406_02440 [Sideroxydans sp.]|nr:hypothetical protein [Sideroxydans sp.]
MIGKPRKYISEHAVNIYSARWLMTNAQQLMSDGVMRPDEKKVSDLCHIYVVTKLPRINFRPDTTKYENERVSGHLQYRVKGELREVPFDIEFPLLDGAIEARVSDHPHRELQTFDDNGQEVRHLPASSVAIGSPIRMEHEELNALEVLYVGQAFGDGDRSAFERLRSHSTLQKILADVQANYPDDEVYVLTFEYVHYQILTMMNGMVEAQKSDDEDSARFYSIIENPLSDHQQICLVEAALIRYFGPRYNVIYRDSFPSRSHKILAECYCLDFSALIVEIDTEELYFSLYTDHAMANQHHICQIDLVADEERQSFFCFSDGKGRDFEMPNVIKGARDV